MPTSIGLDDDDGAYSGSRTSSVPEMPPERLPCGQRWRLDREGIALGAGHHCAQPIVRHYGHESTVRASLAVYNTRAEIDALITALRSIVERGVQL